MVLQCKDYYYYLAPGIDVVQLSEGNVLFRSDTLAIRIEGELSKKIAEQVLPLLDGQHRLSEIVSQVPDISIDDLQYHLDALVRAQVLRRSDRPQMPIPQNEQAIAPFLAMLNLLGVTATEASEKLRQLRVAIFGLEGHGAYVASLLARCGIGSLILADPYPCEWGNLALTPSLSFDAIGQPRHKSLGAVLQAQGLKTEILTGGDRLTRERISTLAAECHMLVGCFDKGFAASHYWINQASLEHKIPAIYAESKGHTILIGPMVLPGQTACYMCYRMRSIACEDNFNEAMSYEEFLDRQKHPTLHQRAVLPTTPPYIGSLLTLEILKHLLTLTPPSLAGQVLEFDALSCHTHTHAVLQKPDCPVCKKKRWNQSQPRFSELSQQDAPPADLLALAPQLVSCLTGVVKSLQPVQKDASEPHHPYIFRAELSNHQFLPEVAKENSTCSGKGMTLEAARISALGEAVERYSGACLNYSELLSACRNELDEQTLDPRLLVLYAPAQYEQLPYVPYTDKNKMGWVRARALVANQWVLVPAIAAYMDYRPQSPEDFIFPITSNGLAAGATLLDAILAATFEVLERDAFITTWLNRLPCQRVDPWQHPDADMVKLCEAYRRRHVEMHLYRLPTDHPCHVFMALGFQTQGTEGPAVVVGLGADLERSRAARKAMLEVAQIRPALRKRMRHPDLQRRMEELVADPRLVTSLEDHDLLYASQKSVRAFNFLLERPLSPIEWQPSQSWNAVSKMQRLLEHFQEKGGDILYYNLTLPDMESLGLHTVRVIIPGFQPIHFGWKERRLGGSRLYELPHQLGITSTRTTLEQLNPDPHPIS